MNDFHFVIHDKLSFEHFIRRSAFPISYQVEICDECKCHSNVISPDGLNSLTHHTVVVDPYVVVYMSLILHSLIIEHHLTTDLIESLVKK